VRAYDGRFRTYSAVWDYDFTTPYKNATCPILLMTAPDDALHPYLARAQELQPDAMVAEVTGANFEPDLDAEGLVQAVGDFLAKI